MTCTTWVESARCRFSRRLNVWPLSVDGSTPEVKFRGGRVRILRGVRDICDFVTVSISCGAQGFPLKVTWNGRLRRHCGCASRPRGSYADHDGDGVRRHADL